MTIRIVLVVELLGLRWQSKGYNEYWKVYLVSLKQFMIILIINEFHHTVIKIINTVIEITKPKHNTARGKRNASLKTHLFYISVPLNTAKHANSPYLLVICYCESGFRKP